ncbi:hypothetical protein F5X99DRAFT_370237 [Biscogniauxia marginata]|nr:hypothetical protein F5X99DRAFT_370237 [Biscogniauxia marginata]
MADHPYGYGQFPPQQPHPPFAHQSAPPNPQPPYFSTPQMTGVVASNYATVNNSYEFNANRIPGLGLGGTSIPSTSRTDNGTSWHTPLKASQPSAPLSHIEAPVSTGSFHPSVHGNQAIGPRSAPVPSLQSASGVLEEGELNEGEFEDLYEPKDPSEIPASAPNPSTRPLSITDNRPSSVGDADGSSIYDAASPQGEVTVNSISASLPAAEQEYSPDEDWEPTYPERDRSGSYSPYLSPREVQRKASVSKVASREAKLPDFQRGLQSSSEMAATRPAPPTDGVIPNSNINNTVYPPGKPISGPPFRSVSEAKKKAQEAILGLWPLKVRYQDYIEEGLDATMVKKLFTDLGLDTSLPKPPANLPKAPGSVPHAVPSPAGFPTKNISESQQIANQPQNASQLPAMSAMSATSVSEVTLPDRTQTSGSNDKTNEGKPAGKSAAEERKDKIARKLAAKAQKSTATVQPCVKTVPAPAAVASEPESRPVNGSPAKTKGKTRAENNALLQKKLAALKERQEKAAANKSPATQNNPPIIVSSGAGTTSTTIATPDSLHSADAPPKSTSTISVPPGPDRRLGSAEIQGTSKDGSIPGLFLSSQSAQASSRTLKRPVASDFDNYTPREAPLKRTRTQETLIIDVSDDEDIEMDIGSPADEPSTPMEAVNSPARKTPLGAFPPLSDTPHWRQRSSPVSASVPTPPVNGAKLDLLHKRIEETKRMIAEAEAKKASKKAVTPQSPQAQSPLETTEPIKLPKTAEAKPRPSPNTGRRNRIASYELPRVDATLQEKQDMLRQIVAQAAQLELEVQASLDERRKLTTEMEGLADAPEEGSTDSNGQSSPTSPITISEAVASRPLVEPICGTETQITSSQDRPESSINEDQNVLLNNGSLPPRVVSAEENSGSDLEMSGCASPSDNGNAEATDSICQSPSHADKELQPEVNDVDMSVETGLTEISAKGDAVPDVPNESTNSQPEGLEEDDSSDADISMQTSAADLSESDDDSYEPSPAQISNPHDYQIQGAQNEETIDEVLDEPNPTHVASEQTAHEPEASRGEDGQDTATPSEDLLSYHSPLGYFRAYRFHPKYFDEVPGGLKSMTYSSRIDPMRPLCPDILTGEQCPRGNACEFQHFETMVLPDAEIITQLGSADMFTGETRSRFIEGLKKVLNDLKANKVKDFDRITRAIVKHRQDFLNDKTKVLPLDAGTS